MKDKYLALLAMIFACVILTSLALSTESAKTLKVASMWDIPDLDPIQRGDAWAEKSLVTETLVSSNQNFEILPQLAVSWNRIDDQTWEIRLRDDVKFHDGSMMTADDVKFTLERGIEADATIARLIDLDHIEVVDATTLKIHTKNPNSVLPAALHDPSLGIISRNSMDKDGKFIKPIGTGPYELESFDNQTHVLTVKKNNNWWKGAAKIDKIITTPMTDANTRALAIENGDVDFTVDIPYSEVDRINSISGLSAEKYKTSYLYRLDLNINHEPLNNIDFRHALSYGIDRDQIVEYVLFGVGSNDSVPFDSSMPWANNSVKHYDYDEKTARELLQKSGWTDSDGDGMLDRDGKPLELSLLTYATRPGLVPVSEAIAGDFKKLGIKVNLEVLEWGAIESRRKDGDWDMVLFATNCALIPDPYYYLQRSYGTGGTYNYVSYSNPTVDDLLAESMSASDVQARYDILKDVQSITQDEAMNIIVAHYGMVVARKDGVTGFVFDPAAHDYMLNNEMDIAG
ncbi:MAG TPA: ABC transporter substrate-binding protein [Methanothrix sp.]|nr:ABC transporter substrate-binding protein [Methanothrix sp.]